MIRALLYLVVFVAVQFCAGVIVMGLRKVTDMQSLTDTDAMIVTMAVSSVVTAAVFLLARWAVVSRSYLRSRPWAVLFWSVIAAGGMVIPSAWLQEQMPELPDMLTHEFDMVLRDKYGYYVVGLLVPLVEETVFRGAILRVLLAGVKRHWVAIVLSAVLFALVHGNPAQMPHAFIVGILIGWMYYRTGSIIPGVAYHWMNNTVAYVLYNILPNPNASLAELFGGEAAVLRALLCSLVILIPAIYQLNIRMKRAKADDYTAF